MPRLPLGNLQQSHTTQSGNVRADPNAAAQPFRELQGIGGEVVSLSQSLDKVQNIWQKAKVTNQYTTARNNRKSELADILGKAKEEPDHNMADFYAEEVARLRDQEVEIDDEDIKLRFNSESSLDYDLAQNELNSVFRGKLVTHQQGEIVKYGIESEERYVNAKTPKQRAKAKNDWLELLRASKDSGFMENKIYVGEVEDTKGWEYNRAMTDAGKNPQAVLENIDSYDLEKGQPDQVINLAKSTLFRQQKISAIAALEDHNTNEAAFSKSALNDPSVSNGQKILDLKGKRQRGEVSERYAINTLSLLTSRKAMTQENNAPIAGRIVRTIHDAMIAYHSGGPNKEEKYLKKISEIRNTIMTTKELSMDERRKLENQLNTFTSKTTAEATGDLKGTMTGPSTERVRKYSEPINHFENTLPDNTALHDEALRMYSYMVGDKDLNADERKRIMGDVSRTILHDKRNLIMGTWATATKEFKEAGFAADGAWHPIKRGDSLVLVWMKDGKPITRDGKPIEKGGKAVVRPVK